jgi:3-ketosteroid 9alpha-monooxygenase subunit B
MASRLRDIEARVARVIRETDDAVTLVLDGGGAHDYRAGQFLTIDPHRIPHLSPTIDRLEAAKGKREPVRAYSMASAPSEPLAITVQEERFVPGVTPYQPLLSPHLVRELSEGTPLVVRGFTGPYVLPDGFEGHVVHLCAGSGIVPNFAILKDALRERPSLRHTLVYSNRDAARVIFARELDALERAHPDRLRVIHTITRPRDGDSPTARVRHGRIDRALLEDAIGAPERALILACGPGVGPHERARARELGVEPAPRFLETALALVAGLGVPSERIITEAYG